MPPPKRTDEQLRAAMNLVARHGGKVSVAARKAGMSPGTLQHQIEDARSRGLTMPAVPPPVDPMVREPLASYDEARTRFEKAIGMAKDRYQGPAKARPTGARLRVTAAGDFHVPFQDQDAVAELIAREASSTDVLVIGGDFGDAQAASTFTKYESVPFKDELAQTTVCLEALSEAFPKIQYLRGSNHMDRIEKRLRENLEPDLVDAILYMTGGELSPDLALVKRYPNVAIDCWTTPAGQRVPWLMVVGDVAFCHAEKYSVTPGFTLRKVEEWLTDFAGALGLPTIRAVVQFHTHAMGLFPFKADKVLIEPGCMCTTHAYQLGSKIGGRPQRVGYVTMELEDGRVDFNSIRLRWLNRQADVA